MDLPARSADAAAHVANDKASSDASVSISRLTTAADIARLQPSLNALMQSCVNPDPATSSIGFLAPLTDEQAAAYWQATAAALAADPPGLHLFVATAAPQADDCRAEPQVVASGQLLIVPKTTHRHRAELAKLVVLPSWQGRGLGKAMTAHLEHYAREELGRDILTLSTATDTLARSFYQRQDWTEFGICPAYALCADGRKADVSFFFKQLRN